MDWLQRYPPRFWPAWLTVGALRALHCLPLAVLVSLGAGFGDLMYRAYASRRQIALINLELCFPDWTPARRHAVARDSFRLVGQSAFTVGMNWWASRAQLERRIAEINRNHYDAALAGGDNIILLAPHFVALELGGLYLSRERPMVSMYQRTKNPVIDRVVRRGRSRFGGQMVERKADMRDLVRMIRAGRPFYYLPDQDAGRKGVFVPFFGVQCSTFPALSRFAALGRARVIPCYTRQLAKPVRWEIIYDAPLTGFPTGDLVADTAHMNRVIEAAVARMPEQYFWVHKRFKTRPPGEPDLYAAR